MPAGAVPNSASRGHGPPSTISMIYKTRPKRIKQLQFHGSKNSYFQQPAKFHVQRYTTKTHPRKALPNRDVFSDRQSRGGYGPVVDATVNNRNCPRGSWTPRPWAHRRYALDSPGPNPRVRASADLTGSFAEFLQWAFAMHASEATTFFIIQLFFAAWRLAIYTGVRAGAVVWVIDRVCAVAYAIIFPPGGHHGIPMRLGF